MAEPTRIFVCYKKLNSDRRENNSAYKVYKFLSEDPNYNVWMDEGLDAGITWEKTIYEHLLSSHVVLLVIGQGTSQSEWVRREISMAIAFGVQVVPVGLSISESILHEEIGLLGLRGIHYKRPFDIASTTARAIVTELAPAIDRARQRTEEDDFSLLRKIQQRTHKKTRAAKPNLSVASKLFELGSKKLAIHIAGGDIFRLTGYDILVNSENDYMHMARIFDMASMSSIIRHFGSSTERGYLEDTIQIEIERAVSGRPRPIPPATALITSSGGPFSSLYKNNRVSHIIHVAAVQAVIAENRIAPLRGERQIRDCVTSALVAVQDICQAKGIVSPEGSLQRKLQEETSQAFNVKSVVLPLFGTGRGGQSVEAVGPLVLDSIVAFFVGPTFQPAFMPVTDIYVSAFGEDDVAVMTELLAKT